MLLRSRTPQKEKTIEEIIKKIKFKNSIYYLALFKGEKKSRLVKKEDSFPEKANSDNEIINKNKNFLKRKRFRSHSLGIKKEKLKSTKVIKNIVLTDDESLDFKGISMYHIKFKKEKDIMSKNPIKKNTKREKYIKDKNTLHYASSKSSEETLEPENEKGEIGVDEPLKIVNVGKLSKNDKNLYCEIKWKASKNGIQKNNTIIKTSEFLVFYPKLLINYYESKIIFEQEI